jgi:hypothetical protein
MLVTKGSTYFIGDGKRACKKHEGVVAKAEDLKNVAHMEECLEAHKRHENQLKGMQPPPRSSGTANFLPKCWACGAPGLQQQEYFLTRLKNMEKAEIAAGKPVNIFDPQYQIMAAKERCIFLLDAKQYKWMFKFLDRDARAAGDMIGAIAVCGPCCKKHNIDPFPKTQPTLEALAIMGSIYRDSTLKKHLQEIAQYELTRDN